MLYVIYLCLVCFCASGVYYCNIPFKYHFTRTGVWTLWNCFFPACKSALKKLYCLALYQILIKRRRIKYRSFYLLRAGVYLNLHIVFHKLRKLYDLSDFVVGPWFCTLCLSVLILPLYKLYLGFNIFGISDFLPLHSPLNVWIQQIHTRSILWYYLIVSGCEFTYSSVWGLSNFVFLFWYLYWHIFFNALQIPVGRATLGRIMNVIGEAIDHKGELSKMLCCISYLWCCLVWLQFKFKQWRVVEDFSTKHGLIFLQPETDHFLPIHREAPSFVEQSTEQEILVTGIKVWSDRSLFCCNT